MNREKFSSQLGFLLTAAGCAIGLGNIYRFPYITGQYGGAAFVCIYIICLLILGIPLVVMELAVGRGSRRSPAKALQELRPDKKAWRVVQLPQYIGNYVFQMFYTTIAAQILYFAGALMSGKLEGMTVSELEGISEALLQNPWLLGGLVAVVVLVGFGICYGGLQRGVENASKVMLTILFAFLIVLAGYALTLPGAGKGTHFYLWPDFGNIKNVGLYEVISAAFGQAFFTLGFGAGSFCIFGSYLEKKDRLTGQAIKVIALDTGVALIAGLIIFPACFTYGIDPANGPNLILITMPAIFNEMAGGRIIGSAFFIAVVMASFSTVIAAFENIVASTMDLTGWGRKKAACMNVLPMIVLSLPAVLGLSVWQDVHLLGRNIMDLEDFLVSNNLLPFGAMGYLLFCTLRYGWGWKNFIREANTGTGLCFPKWAERYCVYILPVLLFVFWLTGYIV